MYKPFDEKVKGEMCRCIGFDFRFVYLRRGKRCCNVRHNERKVRAPAKTWDMLCRCGYAYHVSTQINLNANIPFSTYALTKKGISWLEGRLKTKLIMPDRCWSAQ